MNKSGGAPPGSLFVPKTNEQYEDAEVYIVQLQKMIDELKYENNEYIKYRHHLIENARSVYEANKLLEKAIREHYLYYLGLLRQFQLNQEQKIILYAYVFTENDVTLPKGMKNLKDIKKKILEYQIQINEIEDRIQSIMKKLPEIVNKVRYYQILLVLLARLITINVLFLNELQNCLSFKYKTDWIKKKINRKDELEIDKTKLKETNDQIETFSYKLNQSLPIFDQIQENKEKTENSNTISNSEDEFNQWLGLSQIDLYSPTHSKSGIYLKYEQKLNEIQKDVTIDDELNELKKIVGFNGYGYLNDKDRLDYLRRLQIHFGLIRSPHRERSNKSKKNHQICKVQNSPKVTKLQQRGEFKNKNDDWSSNFSDSEYSIRPLKFESPYTLRKYGQPFHITNKTNQINNYNDQLFNREEEDESIEEFQLNLPKIKEKVQLIDVETCTNSNEFVIKPPEDKKANSPRRQFKYDPSIFYTPYMPPSIMRGRLNVDNIDPIRLSVTLKDIGLEGLDSATPDRTQQLKWIEYVKKNEKNERIKSPKRRVFMKKY